MLDCIIYGINGIANNNLFYLIEEIKAGKTSNKTFLGMMQLTLNCVCFMPAYQLFTHTPFWLKFVQYSLAGLIVIANYLSFVDESNGISDGPKKTLPLGLEDNTLLKNIAHFISQYIHWLQITIFISSLVIASAYGMTQLVIFSLIGVLLEQIYQRNLLPSMLASLYRLTRIGLLGGLILGWDNYFFLAINLLNIIFIFGDYILPHLLGVTTASVQYPISRKSNTFSFEDSGLDKPNNQEDLLKFLGQIKALPVELTFDHMRQSSRIIEEISQNAKPVNYDDFLSLFKQVNFQDKELRACIEAEITANDDYMVTLPH